jgi:hypothetical protein
MAANSSRVLSPSKGNRILDEKGSAPFLKAAESLESVTGRSREILSQEKKKRGRMPLHVHLPPFLKTYKYLLGLLFGLGTAPRVWFGFWRRVFLFFVIYNVNSNRLVVFGIGRS